MPTYDYRCDACGRQLEIFHSMAEAPKRKCPSCGKLKLKRLLGTGGWIIFRGSGFYTTDYRSASYTAGAKADKPAAAAPGKGGDCGGPCSGGGGPCKNGPNGQTGQSASS